MGAPEKRTAGSRRPTEGLHTRGEKPKRDEVGENRKAMAGGGVFGGGTKTALKVR